MNKKISSAITLILFFVWILPLGTFIKPVKEKEFCGGKRAICLCKKLMARQMAKYAGNINFKIASNTNKEQAGPNTLYQHAGRLGAASDPTHHNNFLAYQTQLILDRLIVRLIDHVPLEVIS